MPKADKKLQQAEDRIKFLADRFAFLMADVVRRDVEYGEFCFDAFYTGPQGDKVRASKEYQVSIEFIRNMLRRHDNGMGGD